VTVTSACGEQTARLEPGGSVSALRQELQRIRFMLGG
jgi:hypothetical protein